MSIGKSLVQGAVTGVSQTFILIIISFLMMPFLIHELGEDWYGVWAMVGSLAAAYHLFDFGMASAVTRYLSMSLSKEDDEKTNQVVNTALCYYLIIAVVLIMITLALSQLLFFFDIATDKVDIVETLVIITGISIALEFPFNTLAGIPNAKFKFHLVAYLRITISVLSAITIWYFISSGYGIIAMAWITFIYARLSNIAFLLISKKTFPGLSFGLIFFKKDLGKELLGYSAWSFIIALVEQVRRNTDNFVIAYYLSTASVTHYFIGFRLIEYVNIIIGRSIGSMLLPVFTRYVALNDKSQHIKKIQFMTRLNLGMVSSAAFILVFVGDDFIIKWMGSEFVDAYPILLTLLAVTFIYSGVGSLNSSLYASNKHKIMAKIGIIEAFLNLLLSIILVKKMGILGVALGTLIPAFIIRFSIFPFFALKALEINPGAYFSAYMRPVSFFLFPLLLSSFYTSQIALKSYFEIAITSAIMGCIALVIFFFSLLKVEREQFLTVFRKFVGNK